MKARYICREREIEDRIQILQRPMAELDPYLPCTIAIALPTNPNLSEGLRRRVVKRSEGC